MTTTFTLVQLRYFAEVARLEHMTAAAAELNVTQSTLSSAIAQLERELGVELFTRIPRRGLRLTPAGVALLTRSAAFLEDADLLARAVQSSGATLSGEISVGLYAPLAPFQVPAILHRFEQQFPDVAVTFVEGDQGTLQEALYDGRCEIALMYDLGVDERFERTVIDRVPPHVIVSEQHPLVRAGRTTAGLADFAEEPLILLNLPHTSGYYLSLFRQLGITPKVRHVSLGYETVRSFVARGHGYSVLNQWVDHGMTYSGSRVCPIRLTDQLPPTEVSLVRRRGLAPTKKALAFAQVCTDLFAEHAHTSRESIETNGIPR
ncbi:LysR family transcriptional regulator [Leucobacter luti]|uniref:DNA-binding transcriptional LysR family regulator n=1 Tax=Leucobacter luti TaxID=340320 RepID=A0A4R6RVE6_9MICO|nr:LysR family transcriptional regulator [Leucobacter luti]MCW2289777.1 DNA-binding transcriptional LysR family regulator [Leucobacter luti]QYM77064.1 LysR family transcriptional regulator [Leucobacter luti]TCK34313.1 DNA-binding transcriptional LysR family regulator [Leucobacter luti]TDP90941.1 DNA-binding transcriptional LysR family regulator [Leucobacter luti]